MQSIQRCEKFSELKELDGYHINVTAVSAVRSRIGSLVSLRILPQRKIKNTFLVVKKENLSRKEGQVLN